MCVIWVFVLLIILRTQAESAYLKAPNNSDNDQFGQSVSLSSDTLAVGVGAEGSSTTTIINGSDLSSTNNDGVLNGAVYIFTYE